MSRASRVAISIPLGFLTASPILWFIDLAAGGGRDQFDQAVFGITWLLALASLLGVVLWYGLWLLRRRHLGELETIDATAEPLPMPPHEAASARQLEALGFHRIGETELRPRFDAPLRTWVYTNHDGSVRASITRRWKRVSFSSSWADGAALSTDSSPNRTVSTPHFRNQGVNGVEAALMLHMQTAPSYGAGHGPAVLIQSITEGVADVRRRQKLLTSEIMANQRIRAHLVIAISIAALLVELVILWPF